MGQNSKIEWTDASWSPIRARNLATGKIGWHCEHASEGCRFCYAEGMNMRLGTGLDFKPGHRADVEIFLDEKMLLAPLGWKKPRRIFVCSMTDAFADFVQDEWLDRMFAVMALTPQHTYQVLTKRACRILRYMQHYDREAHWMNEVANLFEIAPRLISKCHPIISRREPWLPLPNVWIGISAEDQANADERIPLLLQTPAAVRFVSLEPLLGPIDLSPWLSDNPIHEMQAERRVCLSSGSERRSGDYAGRDDMAHSKEAMGPLAEEGSQPSMQEGEGREASRQERGIFSSRSDDGWGSSIRPRSSSGVAPLQRINSRRPDDQPQIRKEKGEPSGRSGVGDLFGTTDSCNAHLECGSRLRSGWSAPASSYNSETAGNGRETSIDCGRLQHIIPGSIENRQRRPLGLISWCILGGESGPHARPMHPDWARSLRDQCAANDVPFFLKQWGEWLPGEANHGQFAPQPMHAYRRCDNHSFDWPNTNRVQNFGTHSDPWSGDLTARRIGKKAAGRLLDGIEHNAMPELSQQKEPA